MLFKLTGSSCSGKTTLAYATASRLRHIVVHDFDELGVPAGADPHWRHHMTEMWVRRALEYQERGIDLLLTGQSPLGEVLAVPSATSRWHRRMPGRCRRRGPARSPCRT
jgi:uridine kinase